MEEILILLQKGMVVIIMNSNYYSISIDGNIVGEYMTSEYALIFVQAILERFYAEPKLTITISRMNLDTEAENK